MRYASGDISRAAIVPDIDKVTGKCSVWEQALDHYLDVQWCGWIMNKRIFLPDNFLIFLWSLRALILHYKGSLVVSTVTSVIYV